MNQKSPPSALVLTEEQSLFESLQSAISEKAQQLVAEANEFGQSIQELIQKVRGINQDRHGQKKILEILESMPEKQPIPTIEKCTALLTEIRKLSKQARKNNREIIRQTKKIQKAYEFEILYSDILKTQLNQSKDKDEITMFMYGKWHTFTGRPKEEFWKIYAPIVKNVFELQ